MTEAPSATARPMPLPWKTLGDTANVLDATNALVAEVYSGSEEYDVQVATANATLIVTAVNERETLLKRIAALEAALRPFAEFASHPSIADGKVKDDACYVGQAPFVLRFGDLRRARAALSPQPEAALQPNDGE